MSKKIAVVVRERQEEALRMAVGLTLRDDTVEVYVVGGKVEDTESNRLNLETLEMMDVKVRTTFEGDRGLEAVTLEEAAEMLLRCDLVLPY